MDAKAIWKFPLSITGSQSVQMPHGAKILCVQMQGEQPCLWAIVEPDQKKLKDRTIVIHGTGHPSSFSNHEYIGTVQQLGGSLIWHVFEIV